MLNGNAGEGKRTYAKPTPAITGSRLRSFRVDVRCPSKALEIKMVKRGVAARTTW